MKISPDLTTWTRIGNLPLHKANMHGIVVFKHKGEKCVFPPAPPRPAPGPSAPSAVRC